MFRWRRAVFWDSLVGWVVRHWEHCWASQQWHPAKQPLRFRGMRSSRYQFSLADLFCLTFATSVLLASCRFGWWRVAGTLSVFTGVLYCVVFVALLLQRLPRRDRP
jgi:hypothetical protein